MTWSSVVVTDYVTMMMMMMMMMMITLRCDPLWVALVHTQVIQPNVCDWSK